MLELISRARAERIFRNEPTAADRWAEDYPLADELDALRFFLASPELPPEQAVLGLYSVHDGDGLAVGGIGFFGPPDAESAVTIGYGIVPSARRQGLASNAVAGILKIAQQHGVRLVQAVTDLDNLASQRVLTVNGFGEVRRDDAQAYFEIPLS
ncbi:RimJ/RimL family protein N-acetyltransferase [Psychromicrobium silvestre]|uniref:RimJ/RimL family protein N-acetyltransferase n=1 Tax=Psychromicrobium silvestre TaxID=1645614 RepID=A0A7Y9LTV8_9MICC|nr:GNAT family N-acetyltransferase [Psychromicrobium silvestre]NYE95502.1 RimJ/RimL family protein N-acetyltransferase [Psychromicrobium silvestre]